MNKANFYFGLINVQIDYLTGLKQSNNYSVFEVFSTTCDLRECPGIDKNGFGYGMFGTPIVLMVLVLIFSLVAVVISGMMVGGIRMNAIVLNIVIILELVFAVLLELFYLFGIYVFVFGEFKKFYLGYCFYVALAIIVLAIFSMLTNTFGYKQIRKFERENEPSLDEIESKDKSDDGKKSHEKSDRSDDGKKSHKKNDRSGDGKKSHKKNDRSGDETKDLEKNDRSDDDTKDLEKNDRSDNGVESGK
ncbi:hypothetical protein MHBO_000062 [Bonamia ostreae]|uniref:Uncharacterized protein n=1 Tax=Bonamia ostreae TaxID=126728 RepID=A0ABV2AE79_9EUKA